MVVSTKKQQSKNVINSITAVGDRIVESCLARNLGVQMDNELKMERQVNTVCKACYLQLRLVQYIRPYIIKDAAQILVH